MSMTKAHKRARQYWKDLTPEEFEEKRREMLAMLGVVYRDLAGTSGLPDYLMKSLTQYARARQYEIDLMQGVAIATYLLHKRAGTTGREDPNNVYIQAAAQLEKKPGGPVLNPRDIERKMYPEKGRTRAYVEDKIDPSRDEDLPSANLFCQTCGRAFDDQADGSKPPD